MGDVSFPATSVVAKGYLKRLNFRAVDDGAISGEEPERHGLIEGQNDDPTPVQG